MSTAPIEIHVIADSTGDTAARVARAAQAQFSTHPTTLVRHPRSPPSRACTRRSSGSSPTAGCAVFSTLVDDGLRELVGELCERRASPTATCSGPPLGARGRQRRRAERVPAGRSALDPDYFKRDRRDGVRGQARRRPVQRAASVDADIVLIGVSRTGKTPLSMYLGYLGYKTANVPLVRGHPAAAAALFGIDRVEDRRPDHRPRAAGRRSAAAGCAPSAARAVRDGYAELSRHLRGAGGGRRRCSAASAAPSIDTTTLALEEAAGPGDRPGRGPPRRAPDRHADRPTPPRGPDLHGALMTRRRPAQVRLRPDRGLGRR